MTDLQTETIAQGDRSPTRRFDLLKHYIDGAFRASRAGGTSSAQPRDERGHRAGGRRLAGGRRDAVAPRGARSTRARGRG